VPLIGSLLQKRAASSCWALAQTLHRRRLLLATAPAPSEQALLPFGDSITDDPAAEDDVLRVAGLANARAEQAWLGAVAEFIARLGEPVLVFTEYRDTLAQVARLLRPHRAFAVLHGGLTPVERARSITDFTSGGASLLLATDAASEGLNLQQRCRTVVMLDVPWTPHRIEQRIGRLDRLGQRRRVHAVILASAHPFDLQLLDRVDMKRERIASVLARTQAGVVATGVLEHEAGDAVRRLLLRRALLRALAQRPAGGFAERGGGIGHPLRPAGPARNTSSAVRRRDLAAICLDSRARAPGWGGALVVVEVVRHDASVVVDRAIAGIHVPVPVPLLATPRAVRDFVDGWIRPMLSAIVDRAREHAASRAERAAADWRACDAIAALSAETGQHVRPPAVQPSLFGQYLRPSIVATPPRRPGGGRAAVTGMLRDRAEAILVVLRPGTPAPPRWRTGSP
jgi:hypothetical protein